MLGFGQKKPTTPEPEAQGRVQTIPDIFYGGNDPEVYHRTAASGTAETSRKVSDTPKPPTATPAPVAQANHRGLVWGVAGVVFVGAVGGIVWYYTQNLRTTAVVKKTVPTTTVPIVTETPIISEEIPVVTSTSVETPTSTIATPTSTLIAGGPLEFPPLNPLNTADFDKDVLTDAEEEVFGTDPSVWDTEQDGYYDGQEVFNLYNPIGMAPVRLVDSGTILEYTNPVFNYTLYYPKNWTVAAVDVASRQVVITAANGDYIEVRALAKEPTEDFNAWFARNIKDQNVTDLLQATNRFEIQGWKRRDDLVSYFMGQSEGFVIVYHPLSSGPINYRHIAQMIAQSFRPGRVSAVLPDQPILPGTAAAAIVDVASTTAATSTP